MAVQKQLHFILFPFMAQGHMIPMIDIARLLAERGVKVTIILTPQNATRAHPLLSRARNSGLEIHVTLISFPSASVGLPDGCENFDMLPPSLDYVSKFFVAIKMLEDPVLELLREATPPPSCLIADMCFPWTTSVARELGVPRIVFHGMCCFSLLCLHVLRDWDGYVDVESETEWFEVPGVPGKIEVTKAQLGNMVDPGTEQWREFADQMKEAEKNAFGIVVNSFEDLEPEYVRRYEKAKGVNIWTIGPVSLYNVVDSDKAVRGNKAAIDVEQCLGWLNSKEKRSVVFVCLGSLSQLSADQMVEIGTGLESSGRPFVWAVRHAPSEFRDWLENERFKERVEGRGLIIDGWAPQVLILSHPSVGGFLTHCGWNSTLEGLSSGHPLITWPMFAEQFLNEKFVVNVLDIGVSVGAKAPIMYSMGEENVEAVQVKRERIASAIEEVLGDGEEAEMRRKRAEKVGEMAKKAVEKGGSSYLNISKLIQDVADVKINV